MWQFIYTKAQIVEGSQAQIRISLAYTRRRGTLPTAWVMRLPLTMATPISWI